MPRTHTATSRASLVSGAVKALPILIATAERVSAGKSPNDPAVIAAWAEVEKAGATVHRQSRILAGKSRGG